MADAFGSLEKISQADLETLQQTEDIGPKVADSIREWFADKHNQSLLEQLFQNGIKIINPKKNTQNAILKNLIFSVFIQFI